MGQFYETTCGYDGMTVDELDRVALEKGGVLGGIGYGYATLGNIEPKGDWSAQWVNRQGMGNHGTLVLVPLSPRTRALRRRGIIQKWMEAGLTKEQAEKLYHLRVSYKFELVKTLVEVLTDEGQRRAYLAHPGNFGPGSGRREWCERWDVVLTTKLSAPREVALVEMVKALTR